MKRVIGALILSGICLAKGYSQNPLVHFTDAIQVRYDNHQPFVHYTLHIDSSNLSFIDVGLHLSNVPDTFRLAMITHPEYDDRWWRFIKDIKVEGSKGQGTVRCLDSALWQINTTGGEATIHYRVHMALVEGLRAGWRPFLHNTGAFTGGPHCFLYVVGATLAAAYVSLDLPKDWQVATGLEPTIDPHTFFAPSIGVLTDAPIMAGHLKSWSFKHDGVPHRVVYWSLHNSINFDTAKLVDGIQKIVQQAAALFGRLPHRDYTFMLEDSAYGGLEHMNSVTIGAPVSELANDLTGYLNEIAHEYFHTWNLMRIRPVEYGDVSYTQPPLSSGLWWSEGLTMFYGDLLLRRAEIPLHDSTRIIHLERLIRNYIGNPVYLHHSAEAISRAEYAPPGILGDYYGSTHVQGELIGIMLDLIIRDHTNGRYNMDDLMRGMMERFSGEKGFTGHDIEQLASKLCDCSLHQFFEDYVRGIKLVDFNYYLNLVGMHATIQWQDAVNEGKLAPDLRVYVWQKPNDTALRIGIMYPSGCWGKAGLHTGDVVLAVNDQPVNSRRDFQKLISKADIGDTVFVTIRRPSGNWKALVSITGYKRPLVKIEGNKNATEKQRKLFDDWLTGNNAKL